MHIKNYDYFAQPNQQCTDLNLQKERGLTLSCFNQIMLNKKPALYLEKTKMYSNVFESSDWLKIWKVKNILGQIKIDVLFPIKNFCMYCMFAHDRNSNINVT